MYGVLFLDWKQENQPFQGVRGTRESNQRPVLTNSQIRNWFWHMTESMWTNNPNRFDRRDGSVDTSSKAGT